MRLALHCGWTANQYEHLPVGNTSELINGQTITSKHIIWRLAIIKSKNHPAVNHSHVKEQSIQVEEVVHTKEPIFCLRVPSEVFYVRRNGKAVWTGNSRGRGQMQIMEHQPLSGRSRNGGLRYVIPMPQHLVKQMLVSNTGGNTFKLRESPFKILNYQERFRKGLLALGKTQRYGYNIKKRIIRIQAPNP
jgi:hypothetical protein